MNCPKCGTPMDEVESNGFKVNRCPNCCGLYFDQMARESLVRTDGSEALDIGHARIGAEYDRMDCGACPSCGGRMVRMAASGQPHIHFEQCKACGGSFFDAGEFRDLKSRTLGDWFRDLLSGARS